MNVPLLALDPGGQHNGFAVLDEHRIIQWGTWHRGREGSKAWRAHLATRMRELVIEHEIRSVVVELGNRSASWEEDVLAAVRMQAIPITVVDAKDREYSDSVPGDRLRGDRWRRKQIVQSIYGVTPKSPHVTSAVLVGAWALGKVPMVVSTQPIAG